MSKELTIPCSSMVLVIDESELIKTLPYEMLLKAISRGKGLKRSIAVSKRDNKGFDRWQLYEALKGNRIQDDGIIQAVEVMPVVELREGCIEYLLSRRQG